MKQVKGTPSILIAAAGMKLTQADDSIALSDRIVTTRVFLAVNDTADRWKEISDAEAEVILQTQAVALAKYNDKFYVEKEA